MRKLVPAICLVVMIAALAPASARAQSATSAPDAAISAATRAAVLDTLAVRIEQLYVFPDVAKDVVKALRRHVARGTADRQALASRQLQVRDLLVPDGWMTSRNGRTQ